MSPGSGSAARVAIAIHNHQPVGNFDHVFREAVERAYRPFLDALGRHPGVRISMHWSGPLYEWLERNDTRLLDTIGSLCANGQVELLSGAFYEPILAVIPPWDQQGQIERMNEYLRSRFGVRPRGAWIAERVWEPDLPRPLSLAGIEYTLLDDHHFLLAGAEPASLHEPYWVESTLGRVGVFPIERELRYRIPFQPVPELLDFFRQSTAVPTGHGPRNGDPASHGGFRIFGDDGEKFGIWPKTFDWVYGQGWLEGWLHALESGTAVEAVPLGEAWDRSPHRRTIALPSASYPEMMLWALPPERQVEVEEEQRWLEAHGKRDLARRVATGTWREFLARYPESRRFHRRVTELSGRIEHLRRSCLGKAQYEEARREVHRAQCNCSYWHGVFGGFYLPHLREAVRESLLRSDLLVDELTGRHGGWVLERGEDELRIKSRAIAVAVSLEAGGALVEIAARGRPFEFANVIARRREAYHAKVERASRSSGHGNAAKPETIHGEIQVKEPGLERLLRYDDVRPRYASQEWWIAGEALPAGAAGPDLREAGRALSFHEGADTRDRKDAPAVTLRTPPGSPADLTKEIGPGQDEQSVRVRFDGTTSEGWLVSEWNLGLLTPDAPGRRLIVTGGKGSRAFAPGSEGRAEDVRSIRLEDAEFLHAAITLSVEPSARLAWAPVVTVSLSEGGAERVYQGTCFQLRFRAQGGPFSAEIGARIEEVAPVR